VDQPKEAIMLNTMTRYLEGVTSSKNAYAVRHAFESAIDRLSSQPLTSAGLVITAGGGTTAKIGSANFYASVAGVLVELTAGTAMPAITGVNAPAGGWNVACFYVAINGAVTVASGTSGATLGAVVFPAPSKNQALVGFLIITYASAFTGGTTPLDTATTVYVSPLAGFDPTALTG
jgi:hypothetical protein